MDHGNDQFRKTPINILIVSDDTDFIKTIDTLAAESGHNTIAAQIKDNKTLAYQGQSPHIIIVDGVSNLQQTGVTIESTLSQKKHHYYIPVLGVDHADATEALLANGADEVLTKPLNPLAFKSVINHIVNYQKYYIADQHRASSDQDQIQKVLDKINKFSCLNESYIKFHHVDAQDKTKQCLLIAARKPSGELTVLLGDLNQNAFSYATFAYVISDVFFRMTSTCYGCDEIIHELNNQLFSIFPDQCSCSMCMVELSADARSLSVWNGHFPPVLVISQQTNQVVHHIKNKDIMIGNTRNGIDFHVEHFEINPDDAIFIYTNSVIEAENNAESFGINRVEACLMATHQNRLDALFNDFTCFLDQHSVHHDVMMIEILANDFYSETTITPEKHIISDDMPAQWKINLELSAKTLKTIDPLPLLMQMLINIHSLEKYKEKIFTILSELFLNSLEHGLLRLSSDLKSSPEGFAEFFDIREERMEALDQGFINIEISLFSEGSGGKMILTIEDSGPGFEYKTYSTQLQANQKLCGRGIPLLSALCEKLEYMGDGNKVKAIFSWN